MLENWLTMNCQSIQSKGTYDFFFFLNLRCVFIHQPSEFYKVLKSRVAKYFKDNNIVRIIIKLYSYYNYYCNMQDPKIDYWTFLHYFVIYVVANLGWYGTVSTVICLILDSYPF